MSKKNYKFIVINKIPTNKDEAERLSLDTSVSYGRKGWELVNVTPIPGHEGILLSFQKELE